MIHPDSLDERLALLTADPLLPKLDLRSTTLDRLVAERARTHPDDVAIVDAGREITYRALIERSWSIAADLRRRHAGRGSRIGVCGGASADLFAAIIGIWATGATYVPLDPALPSRRLAKLVDDLAVSLVLVDRAYGTTFEPSMAIALDDIPATPGAYRSDAHLDDVAYVISTSGSTGTPKNIGIGHAGLTNAILSSCELSGFDAHDRALYRTAIAFDLTFYDLFCPLTVGATVVVAPADVAKDPLRVIEYVVAHHITTLLLTPTFLSLLLDERTFPRMTSLRVVTSGGEALSTELCRRFFATTPATLFNIYGPSETTILVTLHRCAPADIERSDETAPIGRALPNTVVSIRDAALRPVAAGDVGEIVIAGVQLANGYLNAPAQTADRFVVDPYDGRMLYRSGDLARLRDDGAIVFVGRNDKQIKIRGVRVEPAEVAAALERLEGVRTAVVLAQRRQPAQPDSPLRLVAYVALWRGSMRSAEALLSALRDELPPGMIPAEIVFVEAFPSTVTGKTDEAALAAGDYRPARRPERVIVATEDEPLRAIVHDQLRAIWETLLGHRDIGDHADFLDLGGDSLLAVRLMMSLEETFGRRVPLADFFETMTIAGLGALLAADAQADERDAITFNETGTQPPLIYLHGDFAGGMYAWSLASILGADQPVVVIPPHGVAGRPPATDVPSMAADVVATIARIVPKGPLRIGGYSAAGLVAYEAASLLRAAGRTVDDVLVIGMEAAPVRYAGVAGLIRRLPLAAPLRESLVRFTLVNALRAARLARLPVRDLIARAGAALRRQGGTALAPAAGNAVEASEAYQRYVGAHATYVPQPYDGRVLVLWPSEQPVEDGELHDWLRVAPHTTFAMVPGTHHGAVARHLHHIAWALTRRFADDHSPV